MGLCGWQAVNAPIKGALTTTTAMANWSIIDRIIDQLTAGAGYFLDTVTQV